jgi:predicted ATPase/tetratricopeptide (TPR) repeat protein
MQDPRLVTLLFTDVEGSTPLLASLGDTFVEVIERQRAILTGAAEARRGSGYPTGCDGCIFIFGSAGDAVVAAVEAQRALALEPWPGGTTVRVRMAIHAGEVAEVGDELYGMALHQAARIMAITYGGQVIVSHTAVGLIERLAPDIALRDLGVHRLRDIVRPVELHQVVADGIPESFPPVTAAKSRSGTLPAATTSFVGRERQLQELVDLLTGRRLVTLTGAGGSGKTRLALEVARRLQSVHRDGVRLVELAGLGNADLVPEAVLGALGMREPPAGTSATEALCAALADRTVLLVFDNCEHIVAGVGALVSALLPACAGLHVLATSREPLRVSGEVERVVPPLDRPAAAATEPLARLAAYDAVRLLVERGSDVRPGFRLTDGNATAVTSICAGLEGLPLAIELVAARLRTQSPEQLAARLGDQLDLLTGGGRNRPDRQQTMRATLDWSHRLLSPDEQTVFRRLSIFAGGFTLDAATQVAGGDGIDESGVADTVERLASRSMVAVDHDHAEPRLRMLEPARQYAAERLHEAGERERVVQRHIEWVVALAEKAGMGFMREQGRWSTRLRDEQDNVRQAMESALAGVDREAALRIAAALGYPWYTIGQPHARAWVVRALEAAPEAPEWIRAVALLGAGLLAENALDYDHALVHLREALAISRAVGARALEGWALMQMGRAAWLIDVDARPATAWFEDALLIFREIDEPAGIGWMLSFLADEQFKAGDIEGTATRAAEAFDVGTRSGLLQFVGQSRRLLAMVAAKRGREAEAEQLLEEAVAVYEEAGDRWHLALNLTMTAHLAFDRGDDARALERLRQGLGLARDSGSGETMTYPLELAAHVLHHRGRAREVATLIGVVEAIYLRLPRKTGPRQLGGLHGGYQLGLGTGLEPLLSTLSAEFDEHRIAGRSLSLERAADLALRTLDEELALTAKRAGAVSEVADKASSARTATPADEAAVFRREGDVWAVSWAGRTVRLRGARGFAYLAVLLRHPDLELHATDVVRLATGDQVGEGPPTRPDGELATSADLGHAGTLLDARARDEYRTRLTELREEVAEAEGLNDLGRAERLREELEMLLQQLAGGKRGRTAAAHGERARVAVTKGLKRALERIAASHPELGRHLTATVRRGYFCVYRSDPARSVRWEV